MTKQQELEQLIERLEKNAKRLPLANSAQDIVPPEGNPEAKLMFIGEAAGFHEHRQRRPFVGAAGKLLAKLLENAGFRREEVWITNVLKVRPPQNRDPLPQEIAAFAPYLDAEIRIIKPKLIVTLGRYSLQKFISQAFISRVHGQARWVNWQDQRLLVLPLYHPAAALRGAQVMKVLEEDFRKIPKLLASLENPQPSAIPEEKGEEPEADTPRHFQLKLLVER